MEDIEYWNISGIVEGKVDKDECLLVDGYLYEKQDDVFIKQWSGCCEDDYHGLIFYKIDGNKYLKISYNC